MRYFAERSGAKYGRAKCNERTAYSVLYAPSRSDSGGESATWCDQREQVELQFLLIIIETFP